MTFSLQYSILPYYPYRISCSSRCTVVTRKTLIIKHPNKTKTGKFFKLKCLPARIYMLNLINRSTHLINRQFLSIRHPFMGAKSCQKLRFCRYTCSVQNLLFHWSPLICISIVFRDRLIVIWKSLLFSQLIKNNLSDRYGIARFS